MTPYPPTTPKEWLAHIRARLEISVKIREEERLERLEARRAEAAEAIRVRNLTRPGLAWSDGARSDQPDDPA